MIDGGVRWRWRFETVQIFDDWKIVYYSLICENVPDDCEQVCLHQLKNQIDVFFVAGANDPLQFYYVFVLELLQYLHLSIGALCVDVVSKSTEYFLEGV